MDDHSLHRVEEHGVAVLRPRKGPLEPHLHHHQPARDPLDVPYVPLQCPTGRGGGERGPTPVEWYLTSQSPRGKCRRYIVSSHLGSKSMLRSCL